MGWPNKQFNLADLNVGDRIDAFGDGFDAKFIVIREGATPGCTMIETDRGPQLVQIIGHGIYSHDITDHSTFTIVGTVGGGGSIVLAFFSAESLDLRINSLTRWKVWRDGELVYNRGETADESGDPEVSADQS